MLSGENKSCSEEEQVLGAGMLCSLLLPGHFAFASFGRQEEPAVLVKPLQLPSRAVGERGRHRAAGLREIFCPAAVSRHIWLQWVGFSLCSCLEPSQSTFALLFYGASSNTISQCKALLLSLQHASVWGFWESSGQRRSFQKQRNRSSSHVTNPLSDIHDTLCACKLTSSAQYCLMGLWCWQSSRSTGCLLL